MGPKEAAALATLAALAGATPAAIAATRTATASDTTQNNTTNYSKSVTTEPASIQLASLAGMAALPQSRVAESSWELRVLDAPNMRMHLHPHTHTHSNPPMLANTSWTTPRCMKENAHGILRV